MIPHVADCGVRWGSLDGRDYVCGPFVAYESRGMLYLKQLPHLQYGHEATNTKIAYTPMSQAYGHPCNSLCALFCLTTLQRKPSCPMLP